MTPKPDWRGEDGRFTLHDLPPIFFAYTRSFLLGVLPALLTLVDFFVVVLTTPDVNPPVASFLHALIGQWFGWSVDQIEMAMRTIAPIYALIVAQQRAGNTRAYSTNPKDT